MGNYICESLEGKKVGTAQLCKLFGLFELDFIVCLSSTCCLQNQKRARNHKTRKVQRELGNCSLQWCSLVGFVSSNGEILTICGLRSIQISLFMFALQKIGLALF